MDHLIPVTEWPQNVIRQARELQTRILHGVGGNWEMEEKGGMALHLRRRLSIEEMNLLYQVNRTCPVFTHGAASDLLGDSAETERNAP
jgi:hypothetical protein